MTLTPELLVQLAQVGATVKVASDGSFEVIGAVKTTAKDRRSERNRAYYEEQKRLKSTENVLELSESVEVEEPSLSPILPPSLPLSPTTPFPHAPTHLPPHPPASHVREEAPQRAKRTVQPASDDTWLKTLETDPTYAGIDIRRELGKMQQWCLLKRKQPSRARFLNWIGRIDKPLVSPTIFSSPLSDEQNEIGSWFGREAEDWKTPERMLWNSLPMVTKDHMKALRWLYTESGHEHLRQSLGSLLANWQAELDKANTFNPDAKKK